MGPRRMGNDGPPSIGGMSGWETLKRDFVYTDAHLQVLRLDPSSRPPWVVRVERPIANLTGQELALRAFYFPEGLGLEEVPAFVLRHLAGVARMRLVLGVPPEPGVWEVDLDPVHVHHAPDALWLDKGERVAVEYDAGYPKPIVLEKLYGLAYRYDRQIWGAPTWSRVGYLERLIPASLKRKVRVVRAPWA